MRKVNHLIVYEKKGVKAIFLTDENAIKKREYLTLEDLKNEEIIWLVSAKERLNILKKIGYTTDKHNFIIDAKTEEIILAQDGAPINITSDKRFSIIGGGSHNFVRNVAGYAQLLAEEGKLRLDTKSD